MCRSIKTLRPPHVVEATQDDVRAAALQYVRKISGFRAPAAHNAATFATAVDAVEAATRALLDDLVVRGAGPPRAGGGSRGRRLRSARTLNPSGRAWRTVEGD